MTQGVVLSVGGASLGVIKSQLERFGLTAGIVLFCAISPSKAMRAANGHHLLTIVAAGIAVLCLRGTEAVLKCPGLPTPFYQKYAKQYLPGDVLHRLNAPYASVCMQRCNDLLKDCRAINYNPRTEVCLLLSQTRQQQTIRSDSNGYDYYEATCTQPIVTGTPAPPLPPITPQPTPTPLPPSTPIGNAGLDNLTTLPIIFLVVGAILFVLSLIFVIIHWSQLSQWWSAVNKND